jgi:hypothetical protein
VNHLLTPNDVEERLRRTLTVRGEDMAVGDLAPRDHSAAWIPGKTLLRLEPLGPPARRRLTGRPLLAAAAAAVVVAGMVGGIALAGDDGPTNPVDAGSRGQETPQGAPDGTVPPTALSGVCAVNPLETSTTLPPDCTQTELLPGLVASYASDIDPSLTIGVTWYPDPRMADAVPHDEPIEAGANSGYYGTGHDEGFDQVWLVYDDGVLGIDGGPVTREQLMFVAASVVHEPGTLEFLVSPPPGFSSIEPFPNTVPPLPTTTDTVAPTTTTTVPGAPGD